MYDVIVIGGGHAGSEAALASARRGSKTLLLTDNLDTLGQMSCNPAIGGIGKGHIVREIDAMGGYMGYGADRCGIHFKRLNTRKGAAVRATRAQIDRVQYRSLTAATLHQQPHLDLLQQTVVDIKVKDGRVEAVITSFDETIKGRCFILTVGTFLGGKLFVGQKHASGGRAAERASDVLEKKLNDHGLHTLRLKTGTPPRIDAGSIDFSLLKAQPGDIPQPRFGFRRYLNARHTKVDCHITYTNCKTHQIVRDHLSESAVFSGLIDGNGPRYCPSIEDKVMRFKDRDRHQLFLEPEGIFSREIYVNGISTGLCAQTQIKMLQTVIGLEKCRVTRFGYSVEYGYFDPRRLNCTLNHKDISNLFLAGQINGTTGYEEAAGQGLVAGLNASLFSQKKDMWVAKREHCYIGVMIDDLINHGVSEPYRMFTARAEHRLLLREDNADVRLTPIAKQLNLISKRHWQHFCARDKQVNRLVEDLQQKRFEKTRSGSEKISAAQLLRRPNVHIEHLKQMGFTINCHHKSIIEQIEADLKYEGYSKRSSQIRKRALRLAEIPLGDGFDFTQVKGLSNEAIERLSIHKPATLRAASMLEGITPAAIDLLVIYVKRQSSVPT